MNVLSVKLILKKSEAWNCFSLLAQLNQGHTTATKRTQKSLVIPRPDTAVSAWGFAKWICLMTGWICHIQLILINVKCKCMDVCHLGASIYDTIVICDSLQDLTHLLSTTALLCCVLAILICVFAAFVAVALCIEGVQDCLSFVPCYISCCVPLRGIPWFLLCAQNRIREVYEECSFMFSYGPRADVLPRIRLRVDLFAVWCPCFGLIKPVVLITLFVW